MKRFKAFIALIITVSFVSGCFSYTELVTFGKAKTVKAKIVKSSESQWYRSSIPLKKDYQKLLWELSNKNGLNYIDMLSVISLESSYDESCSCGKSKGLFQISSGYATYYAKKLKIPNKPLVGSINIKMGIALFADIYKDKRVKYKKGNNKLEVALSVFNKGTGGYEKYGLAKRFLRIFYKKKTKISKYF